MRRPKLEKEPNINKVVAAAKARGMFVLKTGHGMCLKYEFSCCQKGSWVLSYYPHRRFWTAPGAHKGNADTYQEAIQAALGGRKRPLSPPVERDTSA